jgi:OOP family OmpA-OmpF porin
MSRRVESLLAAALLSAAFAACGGTVRTQGSARAGAKAASQPDSDHDGIPDADDRCPYFPEDRDGFEDDDGCPDPDNDGDRIADVNDKCPNQPEVYNGVQDDDGCPDEKSPVRAGVGIVIFPVTFDGGSAVVRPGAAALLDQVAGLITSKPTIEKVTLVGHADPRERRIPKLASDRATAVLHYLVERGVPAQKLLVRSAGADAPVCAQRRCARDNRRVEFELHPKE